MTSTGGQVTAIGLAKDAGTTAVTPLLSNSQWEPFGPPSAWNWELTAGPQPHARIYDLSGRIVRLRLGDVIRDITYDAADRITNYTHYNATTAAATPTLDQTFAYDTLSRIQSVTTNTATWAITYDANGNRTQVSQSGTARNYITPTTSNKLSNLDNPVRSLTHDAAGNRTGDQALFSTTFNLANRLSTVTRSGATTTYHYDNEGRRIRKFTSAGTGASSASTVIFMYDKEGQLLGEYNPLGQAIREYVWFENMPVAIFTPDPAAATNPPLIYFIHPDHLNTPRVVVDKANKIRWRWLAEPFGTTAPETNPSALGVFTQPLRFPGQYADAESSLFYNWNRYYDPTTGRYVESDPIGLAGGSNTFVYVGGNPVSYFDSDGLLCRYSQSARTFVCTDNLTGQQYLSCNGYAGTGAGRDNPDAQNQKSVGPLPRGDYTVGESFRHKHAGPGTRRLTPAPSNNMEGRDGFLIHGNNAANDASNGCVILPPRCRSQVPTGETLRVTR